MEQNSQTEKPAASEAVPTLTPAQKARKRADALAVEAQQARAKAQRLEAVEREKMEKARRADDTRRKVLLGAYTMQFMPDVANSAEFAGWLTRPLDRVLFGLQPLAEAPAPVRAAPEAPPASQPAD